MNKFTLFLLSFLSLSNVFANDLITEKDKLHADIYTTTQESSNYYTLNIKLSNIKKDIHDWQLGFFILQVLQKPSYKLTMSICNEANSCSDLKLIPQNSMPQNLAQTKRADTTVGHVPLLAPTSKFSLKPKHSYEIKITGLMLAPKNITAMPQSLFIFNDTNLWKVTSSYKTPQNQAQIRKETNSRLQQQLQTESAVQNTSSIVPLPQKTTLHDGSFKFKEKITYYNNDNTFDINQVIDNQKLGYHLKKTDKKEQAQIIFTQCVDKRHDTTHKECAILSDNPEEYIINIQQDKIFIYANNQTGQMYAYITLAQLLFDAKKTHELQSQVIQDYPQYLYRGLMLDSVRHFFDVEAVKQVINLMAIQKLNTLHWHLADDEAWRIELSNYPELTKDSNLHDLGYKMGLANVIGVSSAIQSDKLDDVSKPKTGFYSQKQIREIIAYANARNITIIPEIEMPGHARKLKQSYPDILYDFNATNNYLSVQGYNDNVLPVYKYSQDKKFTKLINGIVTDVAKLFNNQTTLYATKNEVSLAADEIPANSYPNSSDNNTVSHQFFQQLSKNLPAYKLSGWQQLVQNDDNTFSNNRVTPENTGHLWEWQPVINPWGGVSAMNLTESLLQENYPVVADFADFAYLDIRYNQFFSEPGLYWSTSYIDTYKTYSIMNQVSKFQRYPTFLGVEGALWSELLPSNDHLWYMLMPKLTGIAEAGWANNNSYSWQDFVYRLGDGKEGFLAFISNQDDEIKYRGYPNGISTELPANYIRGKK